MKKFIDGNYNVYKCKDGRYRAYNRITKKVTSYPRIIVESKIKRKLNKDEQVHHKDENPENNKIKNLEVMKLGEHQRLHNPPLPPVTFNCYMCNKSIVLSGKRLHDRKTNEKRGKKGPFCSRHCSGLYGTMIQNQQIKS